MPPEGKARPLARFIGIPASTISIRGTEVTKNINYFGHKDVETTR
jgi:hypothetical protein